MPDYETFRLQEQLRSMPEYKVLQRIKGLELSLYVFDQNYHQLKASLDAMTTDEVAVRLTRKGNRLLFESAMSELTRLLHNFVAAAMSLVGHTRRLHRGVYEKAGLFSDYQSEVNKRFAGNGLVHFVQDLRHYTQHYELPALEFVTKIMDLQTEAMVHEIALSKESLLGSAFRWSKEARSFIGQQTEESIDLVKVIDTYRVEIEGFYIWMGSRLRSIHEQDFTAISTVQRTVFRRITGQIPKLIAERLRFVEKGVGPVFDALTGFLTLEQQSQIAHLHGDKKLWTDAALEKISEHAELPEDLLGRVRRVATA